MLAIHILSTSLQSEVPVYNPLFVTKFTFMTIIAV